MNKSEFIIFIILCLIFGIFQIILFFKIWGMTNNVNKMRHILEKWEQQSNNKSSNSFAESIQIDIAKGSWGKDVTEKEKCMAQTIVPKLMDNEVILLIKGKLIVYNANSLSKLSDYKVIYYK